MNPRVLKNFNLFVDGRGYAGRVDELELPTLTVKTEEHRAGGMDAPIQIDMGTEALEASFTMAEYDPDLFKLWGLADGKAVQVTARGALQRDGEEAVPVVVCLHGAVKEAEFGGWSAGEKATPGFSMAVRYYRLTIGGDDVIEIDIENMVRKVGGDDQLASIRTAIGL